MHLCRRDAPALSIEKPQRPSVTGSCNERTIARAWRLLDALVPPAENGRTMSPQTRRRLRAVMVVSAICVLVWLLYDARGSLTPFYAGATFAFIFAPLVDRLSALVPFRRARPGLATGLAILIVYAGIGVLLAAFAFWVVPRLLEQSATLVAATPRLVRRVQDELTRDSASYRQRVPPELQRSIEIEGQKMAGRAGDFAQEAVTRVLAFFVVGVSTLLGYIVVPFWIFFVLKDRRQGAEAFYNLFPDSLSDDARYLIQRANTVIGAYLRAQFLLASFTGALTALGLTLFGVPFAIVLGLIAGVANLIPVLGPMLGGLPALIVVGATHPGWTVVWVFLFLFVAQELKDFILVPHIQGGAVRIHPAIILLLLVVAGHVAGFWGLFVAVPFAAVARDSFAYIYRRLGGSGALRAADRELLQTWAARAEAPLPPEPEVEAGAATAPATPTSTTINGAITVSITDAARRQSFGRIRSFWRSVAPLSGRRR